MSLEYNIYIDSVFQGTTSEKYWNLDKIYTTPPTPYGEGYYLPLPGLRTYTWRVDTHDTESGLTTTGDPWTFTTYGAYVYPPLVPDRPPDYDPDLGWDEANSVWTPTARGGGRYRQQLVAVGKDGEIYYGDA